MTGLLNVKNVEVADVLSGHAGLAKSLVDAVIPVGHGYGIEQPLHLGRIHQAELAELGNILCGYGFGDAADFGAASVNHGAVGHEVGTEKLILLIALLQNYCATAAAEVKHEGYTVIGEVDEIAVAVTACNEDCLAVVICNEDVLCNLHCGNGGAAAVLQVDAPCVLCADAVLNIAGRGGEGVFLPFLAEAENCIDLQRIYAGALQAVESCQSAHLLRAVACLAGGDILLIDAKFIADSVLCPVSACGFGYLLCRHNGFGKIYTYSADTYRYFFTHCVLTPIGYIRINKTNIVFLRET